MFQTTTRWTCLIVMGLFLVTLAGCQSGLSGNPFAPISDGLSPVPPQWEPDITTLETR